LDSAARKGIKGTGLSNAKELCARCGIERGEHWALNFADGPHVSGTVLVCPTATFQSQLAPCECGCGKLVKGGLMEAAHPEDYREERG
jgi:hypothetical protein